MKTEFKIIFFQLLLIAFLLNTELSFGNDLQDKTIIIKKIKNKITSLKKQREDLKKLKRWTPFKEKNYNKQIERLELGLKKIGYKEDVSVSIEKLIKKLQKQLKYLNNDKTNGKATNNWSDKDESTYKEKAGKLIDSVIKLKMQLKQSKPQKVIEDNKI